MRRILLTLSLSFLMVLSFAQNQSIDQIFDGRSEIYFQFAVSDLPLLESGESKCLISVDKIENSLVYAYANKAQFSDFLSRNISYQKLTAPSMLLSPADLNMMDWQDLSNRSTQSWDYYPTYTTYVSLMQGFAISYPSICRLDTIGYTVDGRLLLAAVISDNVNTDENEPEFFYTSTMHGDETTGYVLMLHLIDYLLSNYGVDSRITNMVDNIEIHINPLANPDGTYAGGNTTVSGATRTNANNQDLNRNFPVPDGSIGDDGTWIEEIETQAMIAYDSAHDFVMSANFHGGTELANYPWDYTATDHADKTWWMYVSKQYADTAQANSPSGYFDTQPSMYVGSPDYPGVVEGYSWYPAPGSRQDYYQYFGHCREVTLEISDTKNPAASTLESFWNYNYRSMLNYIEQILYGIRGIVTDSCTGLPIRALVTISGHDVDSSQVYSSLPVGNYHRLIEPGTWTMSVSADGYQTKTISGITTTYGNTVVQNVILVADPPSADFMADAVSSCSGVINFTNMGTYSQGSAFYWDFGDGNTSTQENPTHIYTANGTYNVKLSIYACAGADSITKTSYITINMPAAPIADNDTICGSGSLLLGATGGAGTTMWYDAYPGGTLLGTGTSYTTPVISTTTTYYAVSEVGTAYTGAKPDNSGGGGYFTNSNQHGLIFDCNSPVRLTSVTMYAGSAGNRTITLQNSSGGTIDQVTVNVPSGESVVTLNLDIPVGTDMQLMGPSSPDLYRNNNGCSYPYTVGSMITINESTAGTSPTGYYYYFYDWTVEEICESNPVAVTAEVLSDPVASFTESVSGPLVDFTNTGSTGMMYNWDFGDGNTSTLENPSHTYASVGTFTVTLIVDNGYCSDTTTASVTIGVAPNANFSADTVCLGSATTFTDISSIASGNIVGWDWSFGDGTGSSTSQNPIYTYPDTGAYLVELIVESNLGLFDTTTANIFVTTSPLSDFSYSAGIAGTATNFTDLSQSYLLPLTSWLWDFGDGGTSTQQNPSHTYIIAGTYTVCLTTTNSCGSDSSCMSIIISTAATPNAGFSADTVCLGAATNFQDESTISAGSIVGWSWDFGDGTGTAASQNPTYVYADTGAYQVALTVLSSGGTNDIAYSTVYVTTRPYADFSYIAGYAGASTSFTDLSQSYILPLVGWNWSFGDGNTSTIQNPTNTYLNPGLFGITLVSNNGCGSDTATNQINIITTQIEEYGDGMIIYPNPVNDDFMNISFFAVESGKCSYSIFGSDGRLVQTEELNCANGLNTLRVDVSALEKAFYLIEMRAGEKIYRMQFLK